VKYSRSSPVRKLRGPSIARKQGYFTWDPVAQILRFDGSNDDDPRWRWDKNRHGYVPIDSVEEVFNRQLGFWQGVQGPVH
jgi:hypothetical protein